MAKAANEVSAESIQKALESNPDLLRVALEKMGATSQQGKKAYTILGTVDKKVPLYEMQDTRIVKVGEASLKHYNIRLMNGQEVCIPEHCLADYNINPTKIPTVDEDGLTEDDRRMAVNQGAC